MRRRKDDTLSSRRDSYHVTLPGAAGNGKGYSDGTLALVKAQAAMFPAKGSDEEAPTELHVVRQSLFGPTVLLYKVLRDEIDGAILTYPVNRED